jgi:rhamnulokinase
MESLIFPASKIACMKTELSSELGLKNSDVFAVGSHDTASAIVAVPAEGNNWAYLSSGTWSLLGIETNKPILTKKAQECSFTNEGGVDNTIRFLKNIMGLWILQGVRLNWLKANEDLDYSVITELAENGKPFQAFFNPDDERFFNPDDMLNELESYFIETKQNIPNGIGATARVILENLSFKVAYYLEQLGDFKDGPIQVLHIVGGGSKNVLLNQLISNACNIKVIAGPDEGTAAGNIMTQALATSDVNSLAEIRKYIHNSFDIVEYNPEDQKEWKENYKRFLEKCNLDGEK